MSDRLRLWLDPDGEAFWRLKPSALSLVLLLFSAALLASQHEPLRRALFILDWFNVIIHEAGHPIFGVLGWRWLMFAGGTLLQLIMPTAFYFSFLRQAQPKASDFCLFWFGSNFLGIGPYLADARAQVLPLLGGGEHDWGYLLDSVGLLRFDRQLGQAALFFGCFLMAYAGFSLVERLRRKPSSST